MNTKVVFHILLSFALMHIKPELRIGGMFYGYVC